MDASGLFRLWEYGKQSSTDNRALAILMAAEPEVDRNALLHYSPGQRDFRLLEWREELFGATMDSVADCPSCDERVEFSFNRADLGASNWYQPPERIPLASPPFALEVRPPRLEDIPVANGNGDVLFNCCVLEATQDGAVVATEKLPDRIQELVVDALRDADPLLDLSIGLQCPNCGQAWQANLDVAAYCWVELDRWAEQLVQDINRLASAYGWTEKDILNMSALRRKVYLNLNS